MTVAKPFALLSDAVEETTKTLEPFPAASSLPMAMAMRALARRLGTVRPVSPIALRPLSPLRTPSNQVFPYQPFRRALGERHFLPLKSFSSTTYADPTVSQVRPLLELLRKSALLPSESEAMESLDDSGVHLTQDLIYSAILALREDWRLAFFAFKWGEKFACCDDKVCNLMVNVLGSHGKFNTAWCLIRDLHRAKIDIRHSMLTMIDSYAAANNPSKAIWTFQLMEKFRITPDAEAFHALLCALCKHGNIEEAEEFLLMNNKLFPLEARSFNIILNGWCNLSVDVLEAKRVWRTMLKYCVEPDAESHTHMISCFSKNGNLFDSLRLYDKMRKNGWAIGLDVYNSLIYVLTLENCFTEAMKMLGDIKDKGLKPDHTTYNSMIRPLCKAKRHNEARTVLSSMLEDNIHPTIETYHSFLEGTGFEATMEVLSRMRKAGLGPNGDTFLLILQRFFKLKQVENALKIWIEMRQYEVPPVDAHYRVVVHGLAESGYLIKAKEIYAEMISKGFMEDPKLNKLWKRPVIRGKKNRKASSSKKT